ncbi:putative sulfite oxidase, mitochondrial [Trichinella pseudospiralis]|uniref:sulfite oxidase n=1 Tax=Trichinella pseudospiralis TaxID=6337 RepID=A0A0V1FMJ4_TRIPS|nr:putative sulfite oxidase, mitochondrial [Trichinella pseudospiralis]
MRITALLKEFSKSTRLYAITKTATIAQFHSRQYQLPKICWLRASAWIYPSAVLTVGSIAFHTYASGQEEEDCWRPPFRKDLPTFRAEEVKLHNEKSRQLWVTFRGAVYDITEFVDVHPGGKIIMQAVGGPLEPHWQRYNFHKQEDVYSMLEEMRIGNLHPDDVADAVQDCDKVAEEEHPGYVPKLHPSMDVKSVQPLNAETGTSELVESFLTPNELFFKRNHHAIPTVDEHSYKLKVSGIGLQEREFTLEDLKSKFQPVSVVVTLQCAGNRRQDFNAVKPVRGLQWGPGAIGNAKWTGALLVDVLKQAGFESMVENGAQHVQFTGLDDNGTGKPYGASIPIDVAMKRSNQVILAYSMNDKPIPVEHGFPVRVVVPGVVGARSVKWLGSIVLSKDESPSQWQQSDYKTFNPSTDWPTANFSAVQAIQELPVQSAICSPAENSTFPRGTKTIAVKGYAWSGGGRDILRVEVSADNGNTWHSAVLHLHIQERRNARFAWTLWTCDVPVGDNSGPITLLCKATDSSHNCQPENPNSIWNIRGLVNNSWHKLVQNWPHPLAWFTSIDIVQVMNNTSHPLQSGVVWPTWNGAFVDAAGRCHKAIAHWTVVYEFLVPNRDRVDAAQLLIKSIQVPSRRTVPIQVISNTDDTTVDQSTSTTDSPVTTVEPQKSTESPSMSTNITVNATAQESDIVLESNSTVRKFETTAQVSSHAEDTVESDSKNFVESVTCLANGMEVQLKSSLPNPIKGNWRLEVEGHPQCNSVNRENVGPGYRFLIPYDDRYLCGVEPRFDITPAWVASAKTILLLIDKVNYTIGDSLICLYKTKVDASLTTFKGEISQEKLRYGGTVNEDVDVKGEADAKDTVVLDFYDENGQPLRNSNVKLGDEVKLVITVNETRTFKQILPQMCYFSAFDVSDVKALNDSYNLIFVKNGCFNKRNPVVKAIVPPMDRNENGTTYQLNFQAFHFTNHGRNLYIHCSLLACVGNQVECKPKRNCFSTGRRRKRTVLLDDEETDEEEQQLNSVDFKHIQLSRHLVVDDSKASTSTVQQPSVKSESVLSQVCVQWWQFTAIVATPVLFVMLLLVLVAWQAGRFSRDRKSTNLCTTADHHHHHHDNVDKNGHSHFVKL